MVLVFAVVLNLNVISTDVGLCLSVWQMLWSTQIKYDAIRRTCAHVDKIRNLYKRWIQKSQNEEMQMWVGGQYWNGIRKVGIGCGNWVKVTCCVKRRYQGLILDYGWWLWRWWCFVHQSWTSCAMKTVTFLKIAVFWEVTRSCLTFSPQNNPLILSITLLCYLISRDMIRRFTLNCLEITLFYFQLWNLEWPIYVYIDPSHNLFYRKCPFEIKYKRTQMGIKRSICLIT